MAKFIKHREWREDVTYTLEYRYRNDPGAGCTFPCDEHGNVYEETMAPAGLDNLRKCRSGEKDVVCLGVKRWVRRYAEPAVIQCDHCGAEVELFGFTNTCYECGADYNRSGQRLAPREQWGEETGESLDEILTIR